MKHSSQIRISVLIIGIALWITSSVIDYHLFGKSNLFSPGPTELLLRTTLISALIATGEIILRYDNKVSFERKRVEVAEQERDLAFRKGLVHGNQEIRNMIIMAYQAVYLAELNRLTNEDAFKLVKDNLESADEVLYDMLPEVEIEN